MSEYYTAYKKDSPMQDSCIGRGLFSGTLSFARVLHPALHRCVSGFLFQKKPHFSME